MNTPENWLNLHFHFGKDDTCFYCGEPGNDCDHVIPHTFLSNGPRNFERGIYTTACRDCNVVLGSSYFESLDDRLKHLQKRLEHRLRHALAYPDWKEYEIKEMGERMQVEIKERLLNKRLANQRVSWQSSFEFQELWTQSYRKAKLQYPTNISLQQFMWPPWEKTQPPSRSAN